VSRARERAAASSAGIGWLVTIGGAALLLAFGFGIGLVAGSALEEPELVAKHLAGEATELPLPEAPPAAAKPVAPAAQAPAGRPAAPPAPAPAPARAPAAQPQPPEAAKPAAPPPTPKPVAPPKPAPAVAARPAGFAIQVGAFAERKAADELVSSLGKDRLRAYVVEGAPSESARFRVRVGPYPTREQAGDVATKIKAKRRLPIWVIAEGGT
jgi:cell division septation protein DedD